MTNERVFNTIFTIHAYQAAFVHDPANAKFLVSEDVPDIRESPSPNPDSRECTPLPAIQPESHLCITTDFVPRDPDVGFVFGSDTDSCDILLARGSGQGMSKRQFAIFFVWEHQAVILKNLAAGGTKLTVRSLDPPCTERVKSQRHLPEGFEHTVSLPLCELKITVPEHTNDRGRFSACWRAYQDNYTGHVPELDLEELSSIAPTSVCSSSTCTYQVDATIGEGAATSIATDEGSQKVYALKTFSSASIDQGVVKLLRAASDHKYLVRIHDVLYNTPYSLVMDLVWDCNLDQYTKVKPINAPNAQRCLQQLLYATKALHLAGLIHQDIRPTNIMVACRDPLHIKLAGFGRVAHCSARRSRGGYTPYTLPKSEDISAGVGGVDIWAIGIIGLECLGGHWLGCPNRCYVTRLLARKPCLFESFVCTLLLKRPSAADCLRHEFFSEQVARSFPIRGQFWSKEEPIPNRLRPRDRATIYEHPKKQDRVSLPDTLRDQGSNLLRLEDEPARDSTQAVVPEQSLAPSGDANIIHAAGSETPRLGKRCRADSDERGAEPASVPIPGSGRNRSAKLLQGRIGAKTAGHGNRNKSKRSRIQTELDQPVEAVLFKSGDRWTLSIGQSRMPMSTSDYYVECLAICKFAALDDILKASKLQTLRNVQREREVDGEECWVPLRYAVGFCKGLGVLESLWPLFMMAPHHVQRGAGLLTETRSE